MPQLGCPSWDCPLPNQRVGWGIAALCHQPPAVSVYPRHPIPTDRTRSAVNRLVPGRHGLVDAALADIRLAETLARNREVNFVSPLQSPSAQPELPTMASSYSPVWKTETKSLLLNSPSSVASPKYGFQHLNPLGTVGAIDQTVAGQVELGGVRAFQDFGAEPVNVGSGQWPVAVEVAEVRDPAALGSWPSRPFPRRTD